MIFFLLLCFCQTVPAQDRTLEMLQKTFIQEMGDDKAIRLPSDIDPAGESTARKAFDQFQSEGFQEQISSETARIKQSFTGSFFQQNRKEEGEEKMCMDRLSDSEKIVLFISSSMPVNTLRTYVRDLERLHEPNLVMVLRGFVDGMKKIQPTLDFLEQILVKDRNCCLSRGDRCEMFQADIRIDPPVFGRFNIRQVPAFAYVKEIGDVQPNASDQGLPEKADAVIVYGDTALEFALERIFSETGDARLKRMIQKLRGDFYEE